MKRISLFLITLLTIAFLAGCAGEQPTTETPGKQAAPDKRDRSTSK